jgi:anti-anti-sigma regulatory factor
MDDDEPEVLVIEFLTHELAGLGQAHELREELDALIWPELPHRIVIDFGNVRTLPSAVFHEIVAFARQVGRLVVCNLHGNLRLSAALSDLDLYAAFAPNRQAAIDEARRGPLRGGDETDDYPVWGAEPDIL